MGGEDQEFVGVNYFKKMVCKEEKVIDTSGVIWWFSGKESACIAGDLGSIPGLERYSGEGNGYPLQYFCLENFMGRGAWWATVYGISKSWTWLSDWCFHFFLRGRRDIPWAKEEGREMKMQHEGESNLISQNQEIPSVPGIKPAFGENCWGPGNRGTLDHRRRRTSKSIWVDRGQRPGPLFQNKSES